MEALDKTDGMDVEGGPGVERPLLQVPAAQLKIEIPRLERHLPEGASLDKAIARQREAAKAKLLAEEQVQDCQAALKRAEKALQLENQADQPTRKCRKWEHSSHTHRAPYRDMACSGPPDMGVQTVHNPGRFLQQAGLTQEQLLQVGNMIGQPVPGVPPPPPPVPLRNRHWVLAPQLLTPTGDPLRHPQAVASAICQGRSPVAKRKLPPRGAEADFREKLNGNN